MEHSLENRLRESERRFRILADNLTDVIWVIDMETMTYKFVSPSVEQLRGYTPDEVMTHFLEESLTPASYKKAMDILAVERVKFERGEDPRVRFEAEMNCKDGSTVWAELTTRMFVDEDNKPYLIGISRDISERKQWDRQREEIIRQLEEAVAERDQALKENKILMGLLPICAVCKRIRDDDGNWQDLETYIAERTEAEFTHTICPICREDLYPELSKKKE